MSDLTEQDWLVVRQGLNDTLQKEGLPAARRIVAVDDKIVAIGRALERKRLMEQAEEV